MISWIILMQIFIVRYISTTQKNWLSELMLDSTDTLGNEEV